MRRRCWVVLLALGLATGCSAEVTGKDIAGACEADLEIRAAQLSGDLATFEQAVDKLAAQAPPGIEKEVKIVTSTLKESGPASEPDDAEYRSARMKMDSYIFDNCDGPKQSIVALDKGYESLTIASPSGAVRFRLSNGGKDDHQAVILSRPDGVSGSFDELLPQFDGSAGSPTPTGLLNLATASAEPGASAYTAAQLPPGEYLVACLLAQGTRSGQVGTGPPYYERGMKQQFTVG